MCVSHSCSVVVAAVCALRTAHCRFYHDPSGSPWQLATATWVRCSSRAVKRGRNRRYQGQTALTSSLSRGSTLPPLARVVAIPAADSVRFPLEWKKAGYGLTHAFWLLLTFFNFRVFQVPEFWRRSGSARSVRFGSRGRGFAATRHPNPCRLPTSAHCCWKEEAKILRAILNHKENAATTVDWTSRSSAGLAVGGGEALYDVDYNSMEHMGRYRRTGGVPPQEHSL